MARVCSVLMIMSGESVKAKFHYAIWFETNLTATSFEPGSTVSHVKVRWRRYANELVMRPHVSRTNVNELKWQFVIRQFSTCSFTSCSNWRGAKIEIHLNTTKLNKNIGLYHFNHYLFNVNCTSFDKINTALFLRYESLNTISSRVKLHEIGYHLYRYGEMTSHIYGRNTIAIL